MEKGYLEEKELVNGIEPKIICHTQVTRGAEFACDKHYHGYIEIIYCTVGKFEAFLGDSKYIMKKGDMLVIPSGEAHTIFHNEKTDGVYDVIRFEPEILYNSIQNISELQPLIYFMLPDNSFDRLYSMSDLQETVVPALIAEIVEEYSEKQYGYELLIYADICRLLLWILRSVRSKTDGFTIESAKTAVRIYPAIEYTREHFAEDINAEDAAGYCKMSYSYFSRIFKKIFGRNYSEYVNMYRVREAEKLLLTTDMSVSEIGFDVGYTSSSYFIAQFGKYNHMAPKQFRACAEKM